MRRNTEIQPPIRRWPPRDRCRICSGDEGQRHVRASVSSGRGAEHEGAREGERERELT